MFGQASASKNVRTAAVIPAGTSIDVDVPRLGSPDATAYLLVFTMTDRTAGSVTVALQGSFTSGGTYFDLPAEAGSLVQSVDGIRYIDLSDAGPLPPYLRLQMTASVGFDGSVGVTMRSDGLLA